MRSDRRNGRVSDVVAPAASVSVVSPQVLLKVSDSVFPTSEPFE